MLPTKPTKVEATACLQFNRDMTYCGRDIVSDEFVFTDVDYAMQNYMRGACITVCADCATRYARGSGGKKLDTSHVATRGLNDM